MTKEELIDNKTKIYLKPYSFHWIQKLPKTAKLANNLEPFRKYDIEKEQYISNIGEIYFEKSQIIEGGGYWLISIKNYTDFEKLQNTIEKELIYY